jgi:transposase
MLIVGCDFHSRFQQIAMLDPTTGEVIERRLEHENGEAQKFYATLPSPARVGMEATCDAPWFERVLQEHHHELWIGDAAEIRAAMVRKQKTDSRDALHILDLLATNRFPRIWVPSPAERDLRQMLRHRHKLVRFRTSVMNQLHALAMGQAFAAGKSFGRKLAGRNWKVWSLEAFSFHRHAFYTFPSKSVLNLSGRHLAEDKIRVIAHQDMLPTRPIPQCLPEPLVWVRVAIFDEAI